MSMALLEPEILNKLDLLDVQSRRVFLGRVKGDKRSKRRGTSVEFADYRDYSPGDEPRFIDWNAYARLDRLFVKLFVEEEDLYFHVLLDCSQSMDFGGPRKFDLARRLSAALGYIGLVNQNRVSVTAFSGDASKVFPLTRGRAGARRLFDFLEELEPSGQTNLLGAGRRFCLQQRNRGIALVISDFLDPAGYDDALGALLGRRYEVYALQILAPEEIAPPFRGDFRLVDSETGDETEVSVTSELLEHYAANLAEFQAALRQFCVSRGIQHMSVTSDADLEDLVLRRFREMGIVT